MSGGGGEGGEAAEGRGERGRKPTRGKRLINLKKIAESLVKMMGVRQIV